MAIVKAITGKPTIVLTLEWDEAIGLATLLQSGTWADLDELLKIGDVQEGLINTIMEHGGDVLGRFETDSRLGTQHLIR